MPWEVGKLLLQVQWVPNDTIEPEPDVAAEESDQEGDEEEVAVFLPSLDTRLNSVPSAQ